MGYFIIIIKAGFESAKSLSYVVDVRSEFGWVCMLCMSVNKIQLTQNWFFVCWHSKLATRSFCVSVFIKNVYLDCKMKIWKICVTTYKVFTLQTNSGICITYCTKNIPDTITISFWYSTNNLPTSIQIVLCAVVSSHIFKMFPICA